MKFKTILTIAKKEIKDYFTSPVAYIILVVLWLISGWFFTSSIFLIGEATLAGFTSNLGLFLVFIVPAIAMQLVSDEKRFGTIENLLTNPVTSEELILGKYFGALALGFLMLAGLFIYPVTLSFIGRLDWGYAAGVYAGYMLLVAMYLAVGLFASTLSSQNVTSYLIGFIICFAFFMVGKILSFVPEIFSGIFAFISVDTHLENISKGVLDSRDVLYFLSFSGVFIFLANYAVSAFKKKWKTDYLFGIGILIVLNYFTSFYFIRIDMTSSGEYSLSKPSKEIVRNLKDPVFIKAYFNADLPPEYHNVKKYTSDLLQEYRSYNRSKVKFELKNPSENPEVMKEARSAGLYPIQFTKIAADKYEVKQGYMGLVMYYEDRKEVIPYIKETSGLEYLLTSTFKKLVEPEKKKIAVLNDFGCKNLSVNELLQAQLADRYEIINVKAGSEEKGLSAFLVISPTAAVKGENLKWLSGMLNSLPSGIFIDRMNVTLDTFYAMRLKVNFNEILTPFGIKVLDGTVLDLQNQRIGVQQRRGWMTISNIVDYPPFIVATDFKKSPMTARMERAVLPFCSAFEVTGTTASVAEGFVFSSKNSWLDTITAFNPLQRFAGTPSAKKGPFALGVTVSKQGTRAVVVGTSRFLDSSVSQDSSNLSFFMNVVDWLVQDEALIEIRSKGITYRPLKKISRGRRLVFKYVNLFGSSFLLLIAGFVIWRKNVAKREFFRRIYE